VCARARVRVPGTMRRRHAPGLGMPLGAGAHGPGATAAPTGPPDVSSCPGSDTELRPLGYAGCADDLVGSFMAARPGGGASRGAFGAYSCCILPSLVVSSLSRPRSLLFASCCLLFWRVFVRSLREHAGFKEGSLRRLRSFILAIFASKDGRRS
jgi:hypothetical protein